MHSSHQDSELVTGESGLKAFRYDDNSEQALMGCENKNIVFQFGTCTGGYDWSLRETRTLEGSWIADTFKSAFFHISFESISTKEQIQGHMI